MIKFNKCLFLIERLNRLAANGLRLCDDAAIANRQLSFVMKLHRITEVEHLTVSRTIKKPIVGHSLFFILNL